MTVDERVRDALHAYADPIEPAPGSWERIRARVDEPLPPVRGPRAPWVVAAIGIVVILVLIGGAIVRDVTSDDDTEVVADRTTTSTGLGPGPSPELPPQRTLVIVEGARGATSMVVLPSASRVGIGPMGAADGIRPGSQVAVTTDGFVYLQRGAGGSPCTDSIFRQPVASGARSGDEIPSAFAPTVSPDGKWLAYLRCPIEDSDGATIVLQDLATGEVVKDVIGDFGTRVLRFAPDSRRVLVDARTDPSQPYAPYLYDLVNAEPFGMALPDEPDIDVTGLVPDGMVVIDNRRAVQTVEVRDADGDFRTGIVRRDQLPSLIVDVIPDATGTSFLFELEDGSLYRWTTGDERPTELEASYIGATWMPDPPSPPPRTGPSPAGATTPTR